MLRDVVQTYHTKICKHVSHTKQLFVDVSYFFFCWFCVCFEK